MKPPKETKEDRFRRVAEARVNKILRMIRLLGAFCGAQRQLVRWPAAAERR